MRDCDHCGESFKPYRDWSRFCSPACKNAWHRGEFERMRKKAKREQARKARPKPSKPRAPRCQINAEATELARAAMELHGFSSPSEAVAAAFRREIPSIPPVSRATAVFGGSDG